MTEIKSVDLRAMSDLLERLRRPDQHDPACPFRQHCYCDDSAPHDSVSHPDAIPAADVIEALIADRARIRDDVVETLECILKCTAMARDGEVIFDCGDPYELARSLLTRIKSESGGCYE